MASFGCENHRFQQGPDRPPRRRDGIEAGQEFEVERLGADEYRLTRIASVNEGLVDRLLSCPDKCYFVAVESESTDTE